MNAPFRPFSRIALTAAMALVPALSALGATAAHAQTDGGATVTIVKDAQPNGPRNFQFTTDIRQSNEDGLDTFSLDDDPSSARPNAQVFDGVAPGTYYVTEHPADGWDLNAIDCTAGTTTRDLTARKVTLTVVAGDAVRCTFVNVKAAAEPAPLPSLTPSPTTLASQPIQEGTSAEPVVSGEEIPAAIEAAVLQAELPAQPPAQLPRTGTSIGILAAAGVWLVGAGTALLSRSRRRGAGGSSES